MKDADYDVMLLCTIGEADCLTLCYWWLF